MYKLIIGNKRYSTWSLRPWMIMKMFGIPFEEHLIRLNTPTFKEEVLKYHKAGSVPALADGDLVFGDSLAIAEYLADQHPDKTLWPKDKKARAMARAISAEMHSGFLGLRRGCPMNLGKMYYRKDRGEKVTKDVARIVEMFTEMRERFGKGGAFLFGDFSIADAMFTPVCVRLRYHDIEVPDVVNRYIDAQLNTAAFQEWNTAALQENWIVDIDELDEAPREVLAP